MLAALAVQRRALTRAYRASAPAVPRRVPAALAAQVDQVSNFQVAAVPAAAIVRNWAARQAANVRNPAHGPGAANVPARARAPLPAIDQTSPAIVPAKAPALVLARAPAVPRRATSATF
jgi:hypothetical protein